VLAHERIDLAGDLAAIEGIAPLPGQQPVGVAQIRIAEDLALFGSASVNGERLHECPGPSGQDARAPLPRACDELRNGEPALGIVNGGLEDAVHRQLAEPVVQLEPAVHRARNRNREQARRRDAVGPDLLQLGQQLVVRQPQRRSSACIQRVHPTRLLMPDQREQVPADAVSGRLHQSHRRVCRNRRIDGVAALPQDIQPHLRGQRLAGGHHAVGGNHLRPGHIVFVWTVNLCHKLSVHHCG
jgi:hypothetical protein